MSIKKQLQQIIAGGTGGAATTVATTAAVQGFPQPTASQTYVTSGTGLGQYYPASTVPWPEPPKFWCPTHGEITETEQYHSTQLCTACVRDLLKKLLNTEGVQPVDVNDPTHQLKKKVWEKRNGLCVHPTNTPPDDPDDLDGAV